MSDLDLAITLLKVAKCPACDGSGTISTPGYDIEPGCCGDLRPNGECCGNAVPVEVQTMELEQCQWCAEKDMLISRYE